MLKIIHHQVAMSKASPDISIVRIELKYVVNIINGLVELFLLAQNGRNARHSLDRSRVVTQGLFIRGERLLRIA